MEIVKEENEFVIYSLREVSALGLTVRNTNLLKSKNIWFIFELIKLSKEEVKTILGVGDTTVKRITDALAKMDLKLKDDPCEN
jgi:DNA-directed RNA polymerase alpha subunit